MANVVTKSKAAFLMSAARMFDHCEKVYFWTFTWPDVMPDYRYYYSWKNFIRALEDFMGNTLFGLRVWEIHPGYYSHGLHCHALLNRRVNVHIARRLASRYGLGRVHVRKADRDSALYLAKYMTKENGLSEGMRQWGTIGGFKAVKVSNVEVDSILTRNIKWVQRETDIRQVSYAFFLYMATETQKWGPIGEWPRKKLRCVTKLGTQQKRVKDIIAMENDIAEARDQEKAIIYRLDETKVFAKVPKWRVAGTMDGELKVTVQGQETNNVNVTQRNN